MSLDQKRTLALLAAGGAGLALALYLRSRNRKGSLEPAERGRANIYKLVHVDSEDNPGGSRGGPPGQSSEHYLDVSPEPIGEVAFHELFVANSPWVLYSIEGLRSPEPWLVFLELTSDARTRLWTEEAFIDRGIRKVVEPGSRVAVATMGTAEAFASEAREELASGRWGLSFVWNTGRCGSTLLHKALLASGVTSLSEPHWLDQLIFTFSPLSQTTVERALRTCVALEVLTARSQTEVPGRPQGSTRFSFNPKAGVGVVAEAAVASFPTAKHTFMYRACDQVVKSFAGLLLAKGVPLGMKLSWSALGARALPGGAEGLPLARLSSPPVAMMTKKWIETICSWMQIRARRAAEAGQVQDPLCAAPAVRMDEFTSKDMAVRTSVVRTLLVHLGALQGNDDEGLGRALEAFKVNSQAGSKMSGPKVENLTKADEAIIRECVVAGLASCPGVKVQRDGGNVLLEGSLGAA